MKLLDDILVLDFSQYLAGPWTAVKLADFGARVIKIERPGSGDNSRRLILSNLLIDGDSSVFHSMNRNKESYAANLKDTDDLRKVKELIKKADVMIENFRPGIMEKIGLGYEEVKKLNPGIIYTSVTGYGAEGPLKGKPGQDLLVQSLSGIPWLNGNADQAPVPVGLAVVDQFTTANAVQAILASLIRRSRTGEGARVELSLIESAIDFQFEVLTTYLNNGEKMSERSKVNNAHNFLGAPYGIYKTKDSFIALSMGPLQVLADLLECEGLKRYSDPDEWFDKRDEIKQTLAEHMPGRTTEEWLAVLEPADYWCARVNTTRELLEDEGLSRADMIQEIKRKNGTTLKTTRTPVRIDGDKLFCSKGAPVLGEDTDAINKEFGL
ncbi:MAG: CaiB/BaiF CoA-transferase family protein [Spirochaetales bacterium]|nr:CaiB/BaiF CoA-transferase family protein [Spirochaetales bacterium]